MILVSLSELFFLCLHHCLLFYFESIGTQIKEVGLLAILTTNASVGNLYWQNVKSAMLFAEYQMIQPLIGLLIKATNVFIIMGTRIGASGSNTVV